MPHDEGREPKEASQHDSEESVASESVPNPLKNILGPRGVFRFRTFEEFNKWKDQFEDQKSPQDPT